MRYNSPIFYQLLCFLLFLISSSSATQLCSHDESAALIQFKTLFSFNQTASKDCEVGTISHPKINSWKEGTDCCLWDGVSCDNITGHVISLNLSYSCLSGTLPSNSSLFILSLAKAWLIFQWFQEIQNFIRVWSLYKLNTPWPFQFLVFRYSSLRNLLSIQIGFTGSFLLFNYWSRGLSSTWTNSEIWKIHSSQNCSEPNRGKRNFSWWNKHVTGWS